MASFPAFRVSLLCALALMSALPAPAPGATSRLDLRAGYDTDPGGATNETSGDTWAAATAGTTFAHATGGPLTLSLDLALSATAYARLADLDQISLFVTPRIDYIISPRVAATLTLVNEANLVQDRSQSSWAWGGNLQLREQLSKRVDLAEYFSYREVSARKDVYSGTSVAGGFLLRTFLGERWIAGAGGEYSHGDFLDGEAREPGVVGMGMGSHGQLLMQESADRLAVPVLLDYAWSETLSSGAEYVYSHGIGNDGGEDRHSVIISTTFGF